MNKAEERAEEYCNSTLVGSLYIKKMAYLEGYHQAEKDLELGWEDVKLIWNITDEMDNMPEEEFYKEVLKRFKERKGGMYKTWNSLRGNLKEDNQGNIVGGLKL